MEYRSRKTVLAIQTRCALPQTSHPAEQCQGEQDVDSRCGAWYSCTEEARRVKYRQTHNWDHGVLVLAFRSGLSLGAAAVGYVPFARRAN